MSAMTLLTVVGARPQFIKAAVISRAIAASNASGEGRRRIREVLVHTGQHYDDDMSAVFFRELALPTPAYHLGVGSGPHGQQTGRTLEALEAVLEREQPDAVLVYGDTNSTLAGGLAAGKLHIPVAHVEAGLRSYNRLMPEETNRVLVDHLSDYLFCPTERAVKNLSGEGLTRGVHLVGDVMYDSLHYQLTRMEGGERILHTLGFGAKTYALASLHRAETTNEPERLRALLSSLGALGLPVVLPLHPRTRKVLEETGGIKDFGQVRLVSPVSYHEMVTLERHAKLILTDSGGVQKEALFLRVPCVTLRNETEWVETVESGWNRLAGTDPARVVAAVRASVEGDRPDPGMPYGDGRAGEAILEILLQHVPDTRP